jgi:hypothetical protein
MLGLLTVPKVVEVDWLTFLFRILDVHVSNLGSEIGYGDCYFRGFSHFREANGAMILSRVTVTKTRVWIGNWIYWILTVRNYN